MPPSPERGHWGTPPITAITPVRNHLPVAAGVDAVGSLREERHQGLRVPCHARFYGHPAGSTDVPGGLDAR